jgi:hypothetical protein
VDYAGAALTLAACAMLLLPLNWVRVPTYGTCNIVDSKLGRNYISMGLGRRAGPAPLRIVLYFIILSMGMERSSAPHGSQYVINFTPCLRALIRRKCTYLSALQ